MFIKPFWISTFQNSFSALFDGVDEYINLGNIGNFERTDTFSFPFWAKTASNVSQTQVARWDGTLARGFLAFFETTNKVKIHFGNSVTLRIRIDFTFIFDDNAWHHYVWTYSGNGLASGFNLYIDGVKKTVNVLQDTLGANTTQNSKNMQIAAYDGAITPLNGKMDEVGIYTIELTQAQINEIYNSGVPNDLTKLTSASSLISWSRFTQLDINNFPTIKDFSNNSNDGSAINMEVGDIQTDVP